MTFPGAAANECEAFLYGFDLGGLLDLDPNTYGGLLRFDPRWLPGGAFTVDGTYHHLFLRVSGLAVDLCDSGCVSRVAFGEATLAVGEGDGQALVTLAVDPAPVAAGAVTITESRGTGLAAGDYTLSATTANIAAGASEVILTVDITDDAAAERVETLTLGLSNPTGGVGGLGTQQSVVLEITDNDFNDVDISFGAASYFGVEGGAAATVTVTVANADPTDPTTGPQRQVRIPITRVLRGGATDADYSGLPSAIALAADQTEATFEVTVFDDADRDPGEELALGFGPLPQNVLAGTPATATVALIDNDSNWVALEVTDSSGMAVTVLEPGVAVTATVTAALSLGIPVVSADEVEVPLALPAGDVGAVGALGTVTVSLGAGDNTGSTTRVITVRALADNVVEAPEAVLLGGTASGGPPGIEVVPGTITVRDLVQRDIDDGNPLAGGSTQSDIDTATVSIGSAVAAVGEGATVRLRATIDRAVNVDVTVPWFARVNGVDVEYASGRVVFPALDAGTPVARDVLVTIADDNLNEGAETVEIVLVKPRSGVGDRVVASPDAGTVAIIASDDISVTLSGGDWVGRGGSVVYTVALDGGVSRDEAVTVTVGHAGVGGPMAAAVYGDTEDYVVGDPAAATQAIDSTLANAGDSAVVVIPAYGTEGKVTVYALEETLAPGETADTGDRLFEIFASAVRPLGSGNVSLAASPTVTTTISGDAALAAGFASASHLAADGDAVDVIVTLDRAADRLLHVEVLELGVLADPVSLTFNPGSREASFPVAVGSDAGLFHVDVVGFGLGSLPRGVSAGAIPTTRVTAVHNEAAIHLLAFGPGGSRVAEAAGESLVGISALTEPAVYADVGVDLAISDDGTAGASDYDVASLPTMDFVRSRSVFGSFRLSPMDDGIVEEDETVVVGGVGARYDSATDRWVSLGDLLTVNAATVTIIDDDTATVSVSGPATVVAEPGDGGSASAVFAVTLDGVADQDVTVTLATEDGTAAAGEDFVGRAGGASDTIVFVAGTSGPETFTVDLSDDDLEEGDEAFGVTVVAVSPDYGGAISFLGAGASATIQDEDLPAADLTVGLSLAGSHTTRVAEQDSTVPLRLTAHLGRPDGVESVSPLGDDLEVTLTVSAASTADADDYYGLVLPTVTITAGETASVPTDLRFDLRDNEIVEEDESIVIGGDTGTGLAFSPMTVVITDGDRSAVTVGAPADAVVEPTGEESASVVFLVALGKAADKDVTVTVETVEGAGEGAATAGDDFVGRTDTVVFAAGATGPLPFAVDLVVDGEFEGDEAFGVSVVAIEPDYGRAISFPGPAASATIAAPAVSMTATVGSGVGNEISVSWEPLDIPESPEAPEPPTMPGVEAPPEDDTPSLTYEVQYKKADEDVWIPVEQTGTVTTAMLTGLEGGAVYDVRIRPASAGRQGRWAVTQVRTPAVNLRVLPRVAGPVNADVPLNGDDALLIFYFTQFNGLLSRPSNIGLSRIIVRGLVRGETLTDAEADNVIRKAAALGSGAIPASHPANLYAVDPFNNNDALLLFYSIQFGGLLTRPALGDLLEIVVNGVLPRGHGLSRDEMRALVQAGRDLAGTL